MIASLVLVILITLSGSVATYLYDDEASAAARLCEGACTGLALLGLTGFVIASFGGLTTTTIFVTAALCSLPFLALTKSPVINCITIDLRETRSSLQRFFRRPNLQSIGYVVFYSLVAVTLWLVFSRAMIQDSEGISTGLLNNFGDLPFHLSVITSFAHGNNFPPEDPTFSGVRFTYPFLSDFVSAVFVRCGADLRQSMFIENIVLAISFVGLLHRWALVMLRDRLAAILTPVLVLLNGGFGWVLLFKKASAAEGGLMGVLADLPPSLTVIPETTWRWGNAISALLIPQRGFLMGLPIAVIAFTHWWLATDHHLNIQPAIKPGVPSTPKKSKKSRVKNAEVHREAFARLKVTSLHHMVAAGVVAGFLPLVHAHSFVVVMGMAGCLMLIERRWRDWIGFFVAALIVAVPQLWWSTSHSAVHASAFFAWEMGWDHGQENPVWFWFKNTGIFVPLILTAILLRGRDYIVNRRLLLFYLPFVLCFVIPNFIKMAPWIWDNIKVLYYWWLASAPLVALLLAHLWRQGRVRRAISAFLFTCVILAGGLEVAGIALRSTKYGIFDRGGIGFAELIKRETNPRSIIIHAPVHNDPVFLTGRRSLLGYPGHIWTHGLEFTQREAEIKRIYAGASDAEQLLRSYDIDYVVVGPLERLVTPVNQQFFLRYKKVGEVGEYALYKIKPW